VYISDLNKSKFSGGYEIVKSDFTFQIQIHRYILQNILMAQATNNKVRASYFGVQLTASDQYA
jgi:hypothetical protein